MVIFRECDLELHHSSCFRSDELLLESGDERSASDDERESLHFRLRNLLTSLLLESCRVDRCPVSGCDDCIFDRFESGEAFLDFRDRIFHLLIFYGYRSLLELDLVHFLHIEFDFRKDFHLHYDLKGLQGFHFFDVSRSGRDDALLFQDFRVQCVDELVDGLILDEILSVFAEEGLFRDESPFPESFYLGMLAELRKDFCSHLLIFGGAFLDGELYRVLVDPVSDDLHGDG